MDLYMTIATIATIAAEGEVGKQFAPLAEGPGMKSREPVTNASMLWLSF
jgi:hypothetical protein